MGFIQKVKDYFAAKHEEWKEDREFNKEFAEIVKVTERAEHLKQAKHIGAEIAKVKANKKIKTIKNKLNQPTYTFKQSTKYSEPKTTENKEPENIQDFLDKQLGGML